MTKTALRTFALLLLASIVFLLAIGASAADNHNSPSVSDVSIPDDTVVTYGYLQQFKDQLKQEIIEELMQNGGIQVSSDYNDLSAKKGSIILLGSDCEVIYRGGGAVVISASPNNGDGIMDMSENLQLFSGDFLQYGHIYYPADSDAKKCILVTGDKAFFTLRGDYELS